MIGIVLSRHDFREFDQIISLYSKEKGKVEALARGVKKIISKNSGSLEPLSLVEIEIIPGKEINHIGSVQIIELFKNIRADFDKILAARDAISLVEQLFSVAEPDIVSFNALVEWFVALDSTPTINPIIVDALILKLLARLGFAPQLEVCVCCGSEGSFAFDTTAGGVVCSDCATKRIVSRQIISMAPAGLDTLKIILNKNWAVIFSLKLDKKEADKLHELIYHFAVFHSGKELRNWQVVNRSE